MEHSQAQSIPAPLAAPKSDPLRTAVPAPILPQAVSLAPEQSLADVIDQHENRALAVEPAGDTTQIQALKQRINDLVGERDRLARQVASLEGSHVGVLDQLASERMESTMLRTHLEHARSEITRHQNIGLDARKELAQAIADRSDQADIIARLRAELADVKPFPQLTRAQPSADLVVIRFAAGEQTRRLRAAGFSIEDLKRAGFRYHFSGEWRAVRNETTTACAESIAEAKV